MTLQKNKTEELNLFSKELPSRSYFPCAEIPSVSTVDFTPDRVCNGQISRLLSVSLSLPVDRQ